MRISSIVVRKIAVPLRKPFKTALRTVHTAESAIVRIETACGRSGWGEAPPTMAITGESLASIEAFILGIAPALTGEPVLEFERLLPRIHGAAAGNGSAKAALDMALHDLIAQHYGVPLYVWLGGCRSELETDYTVSVGDPRDMGDDAAEYADLGFSALKLKVGLGGADLDLARIREVRARVGPHLKLRLDANQGWEPKTAIRIIRKIEDEGLNVEWVEQPVKARDIEGLRQVTEAVDTDIMADESVFTPRDALEVLQRRACDAINIKLMKAGGVQRAAVISRMAEACGVPCMIGSMMETRIGITAAAHLAAGLRHITHVDLDAPLMMAADAVIGGVVYDACRMRLGDEPGLGIRGLASGFET
ncbi:dipeptide epimerase [Paenibacillus humicola]|uniref:dipeptide epimerase n=1 Tax=Paenibacillus humicola TaxID=3110540 RepID=UPI00237B496B|nr:dipeptide epimerase [Paenibacillus humicola]